MTTFRNRPYRNTAQDSQPNGGGQSGENHGDAVAVLERPAGAGSRDAGTAGGNGAGRPGTQFQVDLLADWAKP